MRRELPQKHNQAISFDLFSREKLLFSINFNNPFNQAFFLKKDID